MLKPIMVETCPDGHTDGVKLRQVICVHAIARVREIEKDPGSPHLAPTEIELVSGKPLWVAHPIEDVNRAIVKVLA